jgi:hypothetical protein
MAGGEDVMKQPGSSRKPITVSTAMKLSEIN